MSSAVRQCCCDHKPESGLASPPRLPFLVAAKFTESRINVQMSLSTHKTYLLKFGHQGRVLREKFVILGSKDAESWLIYILVSLFLWTVTVINVDIKWLNLIVMYVQLSVPYLEVPVTHVWTWSWKDKLASSLDEHHREHFILFISTMTDGFPVPGEICISVLFQHVSVHQ